MSARKTILLAVVFTLVAGFAWWRFGTRSVPAGQPPLVTLEASSLAALREDFNRASGEVRMIVLLSPT